MSVSEKLQQIKAEKSAANLKEGMDFLEENKLKENVVELDSGLQYEILKNSEGDCPLPIHTVTCHYHGTLINGTIFDSSVQRGRPASFPLNMVISGWTEGLQLMPVGSKFRFFIPPHLGYGDRQVSAEIGPNCTLIFDVELISFK
jgi:FKBP-type peptidyl-prolyl cis-trans isomerase FklB